MLTTDLLENTLYVFMPEEIYPLEKWSASDFTTVEDTQIRIILYDNADYDDLLLTPIRGSSSKPIFLLEKDGSFLTEEAIGYGLFIPEKHFGEAKAILSEEGIVEALSLYKLDEQWNQARKRIVISSLRTLFFLFFDYIAFGYGFTVSSLLLHEVL